MNVPRQSARPDRRRDRRSNRWSRFALAAALSIGLAHGAETIVEMEAQTDKSDPEQVFALAQWCTENGLKTKASKYYSLVVKLDKDHQGARDALGMVKVGEHWVSSKTAGARPGKGAEAAGDDEDPAQGGGPGRSAKGPGPKAADVKWDMTVPPEKGSNEFIQKYIDRLPTVANDSDEMSNAVATMMMDEHLPSAIARLCKAYAGGSYGDLYGACDLIIALDAQGAFAVAKPLLPFLVKGSEKVSDAEDLASFCFVAAMFRDKRVVPRLIELMDHGNPEVQSAATDAVATLTLLPTSGLTSGKAQQWWDLNHNVSEQQIYSEQLNSRDPAVAVQAAGALYAFRDKAIVPVLIRLLKSDDRAVAAQAIGVIKDITGNEWGYSPTADKEAKKKVADRLEAWWKEEQFRFIWIEDTLAQPATAAAATLTDPNRELVSKLGSVTENESQQAEASLRSTGEKAVPALLDGLANAERRVRRKCHELLLTISKQEIAYDPSGSEEERAVGIAAWRAWASGKGLISADVVDDGEEMDEAAPAVDDDGEDEDEEAPVRKAPVPDRGPNKKKAKEERGGAL
ncbi:MAG TPA: HEAT repeat domain-containing protein [Planctomycetota bacterium]|nr:HEAT repeat domain-containing protein [Planctomycetota bacterium]